MGRFRLLTTNPIVSVVILSNAHMYNFMLSIIEAATEIIINPYVYQNV